MPLCRQWSRPEDGRVKSTPWICKYLAWQVVLRKNRTLEPDLGGIYRSSARFFLSTTCMAIPDGRCCSPGPPFFADAAESGSLVVILAIQILPQRRCGDPVPTLSREAGCLWFVSMGRISLRGHGCQNKKTSSILWETGAGTVPNAVIRLGYPAPIHTTYVMAGVEVDSHRLLESAVASQSRVATSTWGRVGVRRSSTQVVVSTRPDSQPPPPGTPQLSVSKLPCYDSLILT